MNNDEFAEDLKKISIDETDIDTFVDQFEVEIKKVLDKHAPVKEKNRICRVPKPWFNENIQEMKRKFRKAERLWKRYKQPEHYQLFKNA